MTEVIGAVVPQNVGNNKIFPVKISLHVHMYSIYYAQHIGFSCMATSVI